MQDARNMLAIIPVRGGSKRLPGKNIRSLAGRPLLAYSILTARACPSVSRVVVTSDDPQILEVAHTWGAEAVRRPDEISHDHATTITAMQHTLEVVEADGWRADDVALFQATCPLRRVVDVERCIDEFDTQKADSALTVTEIHLKAGRRDADGWYQPQYQVGVRKQDVEPQYQENGAFYLTKAELVRQGILLGERTALLEMPPEAGIASIDTEFDFQLTEALFDQLRYEQEFAALAPFVTLKVA